MAFVLLIGTLFIGATDSRTAKALSPDYNGDPDSFYYFFDYYPSIPNSDIPSSLEEKFHYNIIYDRQIKLTDVEFNNLVNSSYFAGFGHDSLVIIDIKTFMPDSQILNDLFYDLHENQNCKTAFVTTYAQTDFDDDAFLQYVDVFYQSEFGRLKTFVKNSLFRINEFNMGEYGNTSFANTTILIDENLIDYSIDSIGINLSGEHSIFLNFLLELMYNSNFDIYVNVLTGETYFATSIADLKEQLNYNEPTDDDGGAPDPDRNISACDNLCAIGFWRLNSAFYAKLKEGKSDLTDLNIYVMEADPFEYGPDGLEVITDAELIESCGNEYPESEYFLAEILGFLGV